MCTPFYPIFNSFVSIVSTLLVKLGRLKGVTSIFKRLKWEEQMGAIEMYLRHGVYPGSILENKSVITRKRMKRDFRKTTESYKLIDNKLRKLKVCRKL